MQARKTLPRNVVFEQRTIRGYLKTPPSSTPLLTADRLREFIAVSGDADNSLLPPQTDLMRRLVEKYSDFSALGDDSGAGAAGGHVVVSSMCSSLRSHY